MIPCGQFLEFISWTKIELHPLRLIPSEIQTHGFLNSDANIMLLDDSDCMFITTCSFSVPVQNWFTASSFILITLFTDFNTFACLQTYCHRIFNTYSIYTKEVFIHI